MPKERRHVEWFGPDYARGPVLSGSPPVAAMQVAVQLAQLRVPLMRSDADLEGHAEFIRSLADKLFPDYAVAIRMDVGTESGNTIETQLRVDSGQPTLLQMWLADFQGGGVTGYSPSSISFTGGTVLHTYATNKHFLVLVPSSGVLGVSVVYTGDLTWYWAAAREGRVVYSSKLDFAA